MQTKRESRFRIPAQLRAKLAAFRRRVWCLKMFEAAAFAAIGVLLGFFLTYALDRFVDTPGWLRALILFSSALSCAAIPIAFDRWVIRRRRVDQLAQLLSQTHPGAGDQLLGVLHLSEDESEQQRSPELVEAAIQQVSSQVMSQDLTDAIPNPRHRQRGLFAAVLGIAALVLLGLTASATSNAWARFLAPWRDTPRYTFAAVESLPEKMVVAHGEPFDLQVDLQEESRWRPELGYVQLFGRPSAESKVSDGTYRFSLPGQITPIDIGVRVGDYRGHVSVEPKLRPELESLRAEFQLPEYLGRSETVRRDIRGASTSVVRGSKAILQASATRPLAEARVNGSVRATSSEGFSTEEIAIDQLTEVELQWQDEFGLSGKEPLRISIEAVDDEAPSLICENLPRRKVLLDSEVLSFQVRAHDDFGVKRVGLEWQRVEEGTPVGPSSELILGAGNAEAESLQLAAAFCARDQGIAPQTIALRVFAEDYLPGRERVHSPICIFDVLDPSQHAIWVTSQLSRWHRMSLDVRDRELQLHEINKQLRELPGEELALPDNRERLARQAEQEQTNGRRLANLVRNGEGLLKEAMRNDEIGVGHLDEWAEMIQVLKEISEERMPSVAELLKEASQAPAVAESKPGEDSPKAGQNRLTQNVAGQPPKPSDKESPPAAPTVSDIESSQLDLQADNQEKEADESAPKQARLTLPETKLAGNAKSEAQPPAPDDGLEQAVVEQQDLLAEFEKIADDLTNVLANLEGSTLVKRLKSSSRKQQQVAAGLASLVTDAFGVPDRDKSADSETFKQLAEAEASNSQEVSNIMDDMTAYFERSRYALFQHVLDDMKEQDVTASLRTLSDELRSENGLSISQAEYWSDTFDRWAEDLVEVTQSGSCPGSKAKGSLPPSIVLEVLQLLDGEVSLREQTRVAEQSRPAVSDTEHMVQSNRLAETQDSYHKRVGKVIDRILELPNAEGDFAKELNMLAEVSVVMRENTEILYKPETGPPAIAAETEIIELMLKSKRFNPNASGGSGADPGGGGSGKTETPALALVGAGVNLKEVREELSAQQSTGTTGPGLPEEFRSGLDKYFSRLEDWKTK